jgi:hypothetical protein
MRRIFWCFCRNWFLIDPLHYLSSRSDFGFEFAEIFVLPDSASRGVGESFFDYEYLRESESERLEMWCKASMPNRFMQKPQKIRLVVMSI